MSSNNDQVGVDLLEILEEKVSGYNSGDEHLSTKDNNLSSEEWKNRDEIFSKLLSERGLIIKEMEEDGACLFRAISYQLYGDQEMHDTIRQQTMDYIYQNREYFAQFITEGKNFNSGCDELNLIIFCDQTLQTTSTESDRIICTATTLRFKQCLKCTTDLLSFIAMR